MSDHPLVSVVIATYNMAQYLPEAVDSVLAQSWPNLELIVVDDGSTDKTVDAIQPYENDSRVRYFPMENQGQPRAKNTGIAMASGDFIAFCDADDIWERNKLEIQMPAFDDPRVGVVYSEVSYIDQSGSPIEKAIPYDRHSGQVTEHLVIKNFVPFGTAVIRKACVDKSGAFDVDLPMGIDWDLWLRYSVDWHFYYAPEVTYVYRIWSGQMSKNYRGRYENAFRILTKFLATYPGRIPAKLEAHAWSDMYVSRGMSIAQGDKSFLEPLKDVLTGLRFDWSNGHGWKSILKLLIRRF